MQVSSFLEIKNNVLNTTDQENSQIGSLVKEFINLTIHEIENPGWAFAPREVNHLWSFLRRKGTITTVASTSDYLLSRDVDRVAVVRQTASPSIIERVTDENFFDFIPDPTQGGTGNPRVYRMWDTHGVTTELGTADTIDIVSDSASDDGDSELTVTVWGYDANGLKISESYEINGTTTVSGSKTFSANEVYVSKSKDTTGIITVTENSGGTTLVALAPEDSGVLGKVMTLYPTPGSAITVSYQYYSRMRELKNDGDIPQFDPKWHYIVRLGALAKTYSHLGKEQDFALIQNLYKSSVKSMVMADSDEPDLIDSLRRHNPFSRRLSGIRLIRSRDDITA